MTDYDPEVYWSRVAGEIEKRGENYIAGDDNPFYRYKRRKFLQKFLDTIDFRSKPFWKPVSAQAAISGT